MQVDARGRKAQNAMEKGTTFLLIIVPRFTGFRNSILQIDPAYAAKYCSSRRRQRYYLAPAPPPPPLFRPSALLSRPGLCTSGQAAGLGYNKPSLYLKQGGRYHGKP